MTTGTEARERVLEAADRLFYAKSAHAVGMDELRAEAGVSLKKLYQLFDDFRGCAFINSYAELGPSSDRVTAVVRHQKSGVRGAIAAMVEAMGKPEWVVDSIFLLFEGAMTNTSITVSSEPARQARKAARFLLEST